MDTTLTFKLMNLVSRWFLIIFIIDSVVELLALTFDLPTIHRAVKPQILFCLTGFYVASTHQRSAVFIWALVFCWLGDSLLLFQEQNELYFIGGLLAFLTGHLLYILAYRQFQSAGNSNGLSITKKIRFSFPIILAGTGLIAILFPALGPLTIPVIVYALVLMLMVMMALFRYGRTSAESFWMIFGGAILFMISDSALALNKFYAPFHYSGPIIMMTYISAQYLIVQGALQHTTKNL
jgi:uncharacterized membrane protein YhhN